MNYPVIVTDMTPVEKLINEEPAKPVLTYPEVVINSEEDAKKFIIAAIEYLNNLRGVKISDAHVSYTHDSSNTVNINYTYDRNSR